MLVSRMNVLFLSELFYPHGSGAELATYLYADLLSKSDFNFRVIGKTADKPKLLDWGEVAQEIITLYE